MVAETVVDVLSFVKLYTYCGAVNSTFIIVSFNKIFVKSIILLFKMYSDDNPSLLIAFIKSVSMTVDIKISLLFNNKYPLPVIM